MAKRKAKKRGPGRPPKAKRGRPPGSKTKTKARKAIKARAPKRAQRLRAASDNSQFQGQVLGIFGSIAKSLEALATSRMAENAKPATRAIVGAQAAAPIADKVEGAIA